MFKRSEQEIALSISTSAYADGDVIGEVFAIGPSGEYGHLDRMVIYDKVQQQPDLDVYLFDTAPTSVAADNAAYAFNAADKTKLIDKLEFRSWTAVASQVSYAAKDKLELPIAADQGSDNARRIYGLVVSRGTPTFTSATDLEIRVNTY